MAVVDMRDARGVRGAIRAAAPDDDLRRARVYTIVFLFACLQPFYAEIAGVLLGPYRGLLLVLAIPLLVRYMSGRSGRMHVADGFVALYAMWVPVSALVVHGTAAPVGLVTAQVLETVVPYLLARYIIRSPQTFRMFFRAMAVAILIILPTAIVQNLTNVNLIEKLYRNTFGSLPQIRVFGQANHEPRAGFYRAQGPLEHPILWGLFCAIPFSIAVNEMFSKTGAALRGAQRAGISLVATLTSLSSGAMFALIFQGMLLGWDIMMKSIRTRWRLFLVLAVLAYIVLDILIASNPLLYLISNATLNKGSAWNRVLIWEYGSANVWANPIFGIGFNDWARPAWMLPSVDNYWLLVAMRYGVPGFVLHIAAILSVCILAARADLSRKPGAAICRQGYLIMMGGLALTLATVHVWASTYALFSFLIGMGAWFANAPDEGDDDPARTVASAPERPRGPVYTRFPNGMPPAKAARAAEPGAGQHGPPSPPGRRKSTPRPADAQRRHGRTPKTMDRSRGPKP